MAVDFFSDAGNAFNANKATGISVTATAAPGDEVVSLVTASLPAGVYTVGYAFQVTFGGKNQPAYFALTGDLADASPFAISASDNDELHKNRLYGYPFDHAGGIITLGLNFYIPTGSLTVDYCDLVISRRG